MTRLLPLALMGIAACASLPSAERVERLSGARRWYPGPALEPTYLAVASCVGQLRTPYDRIEWWVTDRPIPARFVEGRLPPGRTQYAFEHYEGAWQARTNRIVLHAEGDSVSMVLVVHEMAHAAISPWPGHPVLAFNPMCGTAAPRDTSS